VKKKAYKAMQYFEKEFFTLSNSNQESQSLKQLRKKEFNRFKKIGLPKKHWEAWRFTSFNELVKNSFRLSSTDDLPLDKNMVTDGLSIPTLVFLNGNYQSTMPTEQEGLTINPFLENYNNKENLLINDLESDPNPFIILNTAMMNNGLHLHFSKDFPKDSIIRFLYLTTELSEPIMNHPRLIIDLDDNIEATIIEEYQGNYSEPYFNNALTMFRCGKNSSVEHVRIQHEGMSASHLSSTYYNALQDCSIRASYISKGSILHRHDVKAILSGKGADITLNGLCLADNHQHMDHNIIMDHASEHVTSRMLFKYILTDKSSGVFNGRAIVRENSQKIDANQTNNNLLLSNTALMNSNPQLEIYADDVRCTHGSTTGQLNEEALFYLKSRGLDDFVAQALLINGFAGEVLNEIKNDKVRKYSQDLLEKWLEKI
tara:strand:+ start:31938 stop:33224 length:1287 start_codon:yes stop_codon:yes gene_type:complete